MKTIVFGSNGQMGTSFRKVINNNLEFLMLNRSDLNVTDHVKLQDYILKFQPDFIVNFAAYTNVDGCETNEKIAYELNSEFPLILANMAMKTMKYSCTGNDTSPALRLRR